jgi:hypothetical protein
MKHKIEPGMLCLVIGGHNAGRECTVVRWINANELVKEYDGWPDESCWLVKGPSIELCFNGVHTFIDGYGSEQHLLPINGIADESQDAIVKERDEVNLCG